MEKMLKASGLPAMIGLFLLVFMAGCKDEPPVVDPPPATDYTSGYFIINEGNFGSSNGSISWKHPDTATAMTNVFQKVNGIPLGDVVNDVHVSDDAIFITVNNSQKIEVVDKKTFELIGTITDVSSPRAAYQVWFDLMVVTDWGNNETKFISLPTYSVDTVLNTGIGPDGIAVLDNWAFICNSGGFGVDSVMTVLNTSARGIHKYVSVHSGPTQAVVDINRTVWIMCQGEYGLFADTTDDVGGALVKYDVDLQQVVQTFYFGKQDHPNRLAIDGTGQVLYWINGGKVWSMSVASSILPAVPFIEQSYYGIDVDPVGGNIYCAASGNFTSAGHVDVYDVNGNLLETIEGGIGTNGVAFPIQE